MLRTQEPVHRARILALLSEQSDGTLAAAACLAKLEERYGHLLNEVDREEHSRGVPKWITRARKSSSLMFHEGLIEKPVRGIWKLTALGWAEARRLHGGRNT